MGFFKGYRSERAYKKEVKKIKEKVDNSNLESLVNFFNNILGPNWKLGYDSLNTSLSKKFYLIKDEVPSGYTMILEEIKAYTFLYHLIDVFKNYNNSEKPYAEFLNQCFRNGSPSSIALHELNQFYKIDYGSVTYGLIIKIIFRDDSFAPESSYIGEV